MHHLKGRRSRLGLLLRLLAAPVVVVLATTALGAQTLPVPVLPPEIVVPDTPPLTPDGKPAPAQPFEPVPQLRPRAWEYALGAGAGWDSNIEFAQPDGPGGGVFAPRARAARIFWSPRGELRAVAGTRWDAYPSDSELNRYYADFSLDGEYHPGPHTTWRGDASYGFGYTDAYPILLQQGVALPLAKTRMLVGGVTFLQQLAPRTTLRIDARINRAEFEAPLLTNGSALRGTVALERQLGVRNTVALVYAVEDVLTDEANRHYTTHFGSLQWTRLLSLRSAFLLEGGLSYTADAARVGLGQRESFFGGASYTRKVGASGVTLFLRREVTPAFGLAVSLLETRGGLRVEAPLSRDWRLRLEGDHTQPDNAEAAGLIGRPPYSEAIFQVVRRIGKTAEVSGETRYRRRGATSTLGLISSFQAGVYITLTPPGGAKLPPQGLF
jgi:hypothetical protein